MEDLIMISSIFIFLIICVMVSIVLMTKTGKNNRKIIIKNVKKLPVKKPRYDVLYVCDGHCYIWCKDDFDRLNNYDYIKFYTDYNPDKVLFFVKDN